MLNFCGIFRVQGKAWNMFCSWRKWNPMISRKKEKQADSGEGMHTSNLNQNISSHLVSLHPPPSLSAVIPLSTLSLVKTFPLSLFRKVTIFWLITPPLLHPWPTSLNTVFRNLTIPPTTLPSPTYTKNTFQVGVGNDSLSKGFCWRTKRISLIPNFKKERLLLTSNWQR